LIIIRIKSVFKGEWKNPSITLLASEQLESSSLGFLRPKEDTSRWPMPQRSMAAAGCFSYGPNELRQRDSRVFFVQTYGPSAFLGTHIQITKFILIKLRNSTISKCRPHFHLLNILLGKKKFFCLSGIILSPTTRCMRERVMYSNQIMQSRTCLVTIFELNCISFWSLHGSLS